MRNAAAGGRLRKNAVCAALFWILSGLLTGCGLHPENAAGESTAVFGQESGWEQEPSGHKEKGKDFRESVTEGENTGILEETVAEGKGIETLDAVTADGDSVCFTDVKGQAYTFLVNPAVEKHGYDLQAFVREKDRLSYVGDAGFSSRLGLDVSHHHGTIDWEKVRDAGFSFAFIRLGCRRYGETGEICLDREFKNNMENARRAGLDVGVYFFSQATDEEEAREEAAFVLENLEGCQLQLPVVFDPERIDWDEARTDCVSGEQFTENAEIFCSMIREAGFAPMLYCNLYWQAFELDLERLSWIPVWYADYEELPQTPYRFTFWQYTNTATVDGITGPVDLNIQLIPTGL